MQENPKIFEIHAEKIMRFRNGVRKLGLGVMGNDASAICPVVIKDDCLSGRIAKLILERGMYVVAIGYPVAPIGEARLRMIIQAGHTNEQIDRALQIFKEFIDDFDLLRMIKEYKGKITPEIRAFGIKQYLKSWFVPVDMKMVA